MATTMPTTSSTRRPPTRGVPSESLGGADDIIVIGASLFSERFTDDDTG